MYEASDHDTSLDVCMNGVKMIIRRQLATVFAFSQKRNGLESPSSRAPDAVESVRLLQRVGYALTSTYSHLDELRKTANSGSFARNSSLQTRKDHDCEREHRST